MKFTKDESKTRAFSGGFIRETGFYTCTITKAYENKSERTLSESVRFEVVTESGSTGRFDIWVINKEGAPVERSQNQINDLMVLLDLENIQSKPGKVMVYDFDLRQDTEQRKMVFHELLNQSIGIIFAMRENTFNGKTTNRAEFVGFYGPDTKETAGEMIEGIDPKQWQNDLAYWSGDHQAIKQAANQANSPQNSSPIDPINMDDIPF